MPAKKQQPKPRNKPLKRPRQARARFTVQAIFDAYVRIWQRDGWQRLTTRSVALETGIAVGTLYDYFPSKEALHSGYVRHCLEQLVEQVQQQAVQADGLSWQQRIRILVAFLSGQHPDNTLWFHPDMLALEPLVAGPKHQRRAWEELLGLWKSVVAASPDLPAPVSDATLESLHLSVWGGRRYAILVDLDDKAQARWAEDITQFCLERLSRG